MIKAILWDVDGTLLDFLPSERHSLKKAFLHFNLGECPDELVAEYSKINLKHWKMLERGEVTKAQVLTGRFVEFLEYCGIDSVTPEDFCAQYESGLTEVVAPIDDCIDLLTELSADYKQYIVTNGAERVQNKKLSRSGLDKIVDGVYISDSVGYEKPNKKFFDAVLSDTDCTKDEVIIVGDSLTSDMQGGINSGIKTCWYNPNDNPKPKNIDYSINNLWQIKEILA